MWVLVADADKHSFPPLSRSQRNQRKSEAFRDKPAANTHGVFRGIAHTRLWAMRPAFNTVIIGAELHFIGAVTRGVTLFHPSRPAVTGRKQKSRHRGVGWVTAPAFFAQNRPTAFSPIPHSPSAQECDRAQRCGLSHARLSPRMPASLRPCHRY